MTVDNLQLKEGKRKLIFGFLYQFMDIKRISR